ncbi:MAG: M3 family metallopeptidase [Candidatus Saccharimonadales bacterium]
MKNAFLGPVDELRFGQYRPEMVKESLDATEAVAWKRVEQLLAFETGARTIENTLLALYRAAEEFNAVVSICSHHMSVLGKEWNAPAQLASQRAAAYSNEISFHEGIYKALVELRARRNYLATVSAPRRKLLDETILDYERNGIALAPKKRSELKSIRAALDAATTMFDQNVVTATDEAELRVETKQDLAGLDEEFIIECAQAASGEDKASYRIDFNPPNYIKVMSECQVRATRQRMYHLSIQRAAELNRDLAKEILTLRRRQAQLLGYKHYADFVLEERMADKGVVAWRFITELAQKYRRQAGAEFAALQRFARDDEANPELVLDAADIDTGLNFYYALRLQKQNSGLDQGTIKQHFPLAAVRDYMFATLTTLYGLRFSLGDQSTWHEDVEVYEISRADGSHIATVWCDWYARKGKKSGAWMNSYYVADRAGGVVSKPHLGYVVTNFDPPRGAKPSLLSLQDVETLWHEFGHFIHLATGETELEEQSMMSCKWDFVEAPSQIMENWVWQPEILAGMSRHYLTGKRLSDRQVDTLIRDKNFMVASKAMRQFGLATVDLSLHIDFDPMKDEDVLAYARSVKANFLPVEVYAEDSSITTFSHIFAGGYAAAYYSYKWAEAIEADLFSRFKEEGVLNPQTGTDYRRLVLARGDEVNPQILIKDFLGRSSSSAAMLERDGIGVSTGTSSDEAVD